MDPQKRKVFSSGPPAACGYYLGDPELSIPVSSSPRQAVPHNRQRQPFDEIKKDCLSKRNLYHDPNFPAKDSSIFVSKDPPYKFVWKRPHELVESPKLFADGAQTFDVSQGMLGDSWLLASMASLSDNKSMLDQVIPDGQSFEADYCGLFRFRFWQYGHWEEVVIDDRLPTYNGKLVFLHSNENNEFWCSLLEKAYAKLCGSYEALSGGHTSEALVDFTGGCVETYELRGKQPNNLYDIMLKVGKKPALMCVSTQAKPGQLELKLDNGLIVGHSYTVVAVEKLSSRGYELLRIRNPWKDSSDWKGAWSEGSANWQRLNEKDRTMLGVDMQGEGEFWMSFDDFCANFDKIDICLLSPEAPGDSPNQNWEVKIHQGSWQKFVSAGGCRNFPDTFHLNPQYRLKLEIPDEDDDSESDDVGKCTFMLSLMQKHRRKARNVGTQHLTIGFTLYLLGDNTANYYEYGRLTKEFFLYHKSVARSETFVNSREVTGRFTLPVGEYVVIPSTFDPKEEGDFILRVFAEQPPQAQCMDTHTQIEIKDEANAPTKSPAFNDEVNSEVHPRLSFDDKYRRIFNKTAGEDGDIDPFELQAVTSNILKAEGRWFSLDACRCMISMVDKQRNGKLTYEEFRLLWKRIVEWEEQYSKYDHNQDGHLNVSELRRVMCQLGFHLNTPAISSIALRWATRNGGVCLEDFVQICCRVRSAFDSFLAFQGKSFSLNNYITQAVYI